MSSILVYHGSVHKVERPLCHIGREFVDFGQGFYVTDIQEQARAWAIRRGENLERPALLNVYTLEREALLREAHSKIFTAYDRAWLQFIIANRRGENAVAYDYIEGGVANDRVINSINLYLQGYTSEEDALRLLALHQPNNQMCIRKQELIDKYLHYERTESL